MDVHSNWTNTNPTMPELDDVARAIAKTAIDNRVLEKILYEIFDTLDPVYVLKELGFILNVNIKSLEYTTDEEAEVAVKYKSFDNKEK
jgi:hypothetical protein